LDAEGQQALHAAMVDLLARENRNGRQGLAIPAEYLEIVITR
jgi:hypothetical protein